MNEMTLPSRHRIRNYNPGGLRPSYRSVTESPHKTEFFYESMHGKKHFCFFQTAETGKRTPNSSVKGSGAKHRNRLHSLEANVMMGIKSQPCSNNRGNIMFQAMLSKIMIVAVLTTVLCIIRSITLAKL